MKNDRYSDLFGFDSCTNIDVHPACYSNKPFGDLRRIYLLRHVEDRLRIGVLQRAGLLTRRRDGRKLFFSVAEPHREAIIRCIEGRYSSKWHCPKRRLAIASLLP